MEFFQIHQRKLFKLLLFECLNFMEYRESLCTIRLDLQEEDLSCCILWSHGKRGTRCSWSGIILFYRFSLCMTYSTGYAVNGLFSQSYGAKNYELLVVQLQKTLLVSTLIYFGFTYEMLINR